MQNLCNGFSERTAMVPRQLRSMIAWSYLPQRISHALLRAHPDSRSEAFVVPLVHASATKPLTVVT
jgi:hypothetical protein